MVCDRLSRRRRFQSDAGGTSLTFIAPIADTVQYAMLSTGLTLNFGIATVAGVFAGSLVTALATAAFIGKVLPIAAPHAAFGRRRGADGRGRRDGLGCSIGQGLTGVSTWRWRRSLQSPGFCSAQPPVCAECSAFSR
jgi:hypothetical protein